MNDQERYLFDLKGYLAVPDALSQEQVAKTQRRVRRAHRGRVSAGYAHAQVWAGARMGEGVSRSDRQPGDYSLPVRSCWATTFRLDHVYLDVIRSGKGPIGTRLHGGAIPFNPTHYFRFEGDQMHNGLSVVAYNLKDVGSLRRRFWLRAGLAQEQLFVPG